MFISSSLLGCNYFTFCLKHRTVQHFWFSFRFSFNPHSSPSGLYYMVFDVAHEQAACITFQQFFFFFFFPFLSYFSSYTGRLRLMKRKSKMRRGGHYSSCAGDKWSCHFLQVWLTCRRSIFVLPPGLQACSSTSPGAPSAPGQRRYQL